MQTIDFSVNSGMMLNMFDLTAAPISSYGDRFEKQLLISLVNGSVSCFSYENRTSTNDEFQIVQSPCSKCQTLSKHKFHVTIDI